MQQRVTTVTPREDLAVALQVMLWRGFRHLPVCRADGQLVGMLSDRDVLAGAGIRASGVEGKVEDAMSAPVQTTTPDTPIEDAAAVLATAKVGCLPVVDGGRLVGLLTVTDVLAHVAQVPVEALGPMEESVTTVMTREVDTIGPGDSLFDAALRMHQGGYRHLPVVDPDDRVIGILSDRDVRNAFGDPRKLVERDDVDHEHALGIRVDEAMTSEPITVLEEATLGDAVAAFLDARVGAIPVVDGETGRLRGLVSYLDALAAASERGN